MKKEILKLLRRKGKLSTYQIAQELDLSWSTVKNALNELVLDGKVVRKLGRTGFREKYVWYLRGRK